MRRILIFFTSVVLLASCGGGGGGGGSSSAIATPTITLSGTATFDSVPTTAASGLNYAATVAKPIRNAVVEVRNSSGTTVFYRASTDATGAFSILAPQSTAVRVVVLSAMGTLASPETKVIDNARGDAVYGAFINLTTTTTDLAGQNIHAASGWTGVGLSGAYTAPRSAAPFAILDVAHDALALIKNADAGATIPALVIGWSDLNDETRIGTSHFSPSTGRLSILGDAGVDTDEFDDHVIAHEIGHWFEDNFSRSDSIGGGHSGGDILEEPVAFGEGFGNAFSGMVTNNRYYRDTMGSQQASTGNKFDLESDSVSDVATVGGGDPRLIDGGWSEFSVQEILYDCFDGSGGSTDVDADGVALGFTPIYQVMTGGERTTRAFTSVYSFLTLLEAAQPASAAAIVTLAANENILAHDIFEQTVAGRRRYTTVPSTGVSVTVDVDGDALTTYATYGVINSSNPGNKLYNWLYFKATVPSAGTWRFRVTPTTGTHDVIIRAGYGVSPKTRDVFIGGDERLDFAGSAGQVVVFAVGSFAVESINASGVTPFTVRFGTTATAGKPATITPAVEPEAIKVTEPNSNG